jgi:hypothetical protein
VNGPEHADTLSAKHNLAVVLDEQGEFAEARYRYEKVLQARERLLGPEHPDTLATRRGLEECL